MLNITIKTLLGVGRTGVVGVLRVLRSGDGEQAIGLRAHIGALPTETARVKRNPTMPEITSL